MRGIIADIGGTNARFALVDNGTYHDELVLPCADYAGPVDAVEDYLKKISASKRPERGSFAVAGAVRGDMFSFTNNLAWTISVEKTRADLGFQSLTLMNDFKAVALSIPHLKNDALKTVSLTDQVEQGGAIGVIGPGTGLGVASLVWDGKKYIANPGEGGHVTMAAKTQREFDIFSFLKTRYQHVSAERVCSGKGLVNLYDALRAIDKMDSLPDRTAEEISHLAIQKHCKVCEEALALMMVFLGRISGDLALTLGAYGGIYIAGGITGKLGDYFFKSGFQDEFVSKGTTFKPYMESIPVFLVTHPLPAFVGLYADLMAQKAG